MEVGDEPRELRRVAVLEENGFRCAGQDRGVVLADDVRAAAERVHVTKGGAQRIRVTGRHGRMKSRQPLVDLLRERLTQAGKGGCGQPRPGALRRYS
ncbi:MAG: hypothetical protein QOE05_3428 [Actinomycetota bacterium]|nr:hypothetical protein [Actinomycetota bacterium]